MSGKSILIVDDDQDITKLLKIGLEKRGYRVTTFNDPKDALSHFKEGIYDLLILDIRMPNMTGFELFRELRKIDSKARVCFFTAFEIYSEEFHTLFPELESDCFLRKPMSIADFAASVRRLVGE
jgi:two-component system, OmpR family, response regulator ChvI